MDDQMIIELFNKRSHEAITAVSDKYGSLCKSISKRILQNTQDAEECVNDAYLVLWNTIPPENPNPFAAYICRIVKNITLKKYRYNTAEKRNAHYDLSIFTNISVSAFVKNVIYDEISPDVRYASKEAKLLHPEETINMPETPEKISAYLYQRALLDNSEVKINQGIPGNFSCTNITLNQAIIMNDKNQGSLLEAGSFAVVYKEKNGEMDLIKDTIGLIGMNALCEKKKRMNFMKS